MAKQQRRASPGELWAHLGAGYKIMEALGYDHFPSDHNPVWEAVAGLSPLTEEQINQMADELIEAEVLQEHEVGNFVAAQLSAQAMGADLAELLRPVVWKGKIPQKSAILRAFILAQTVVLNSVDGPIGTGELGTIRQRWYFSKHVRASGFKFAAQALENHLIKSADVVLVHDARSRDRALKLGAQRAEFKVNWKKRDEQALRDELGRQARIHTWPKNEWGRSYAMQQSGLLGDLVRDGLLYEQLWIRDASRDVATFSPLLPDFHAILAVEKQGLFEHFQPFCKAAGIPLLLAMSGNNAFSGVEAILNDHFRKWDGQYKPTLDNPLHIMVISDHDYAGMVPVQAGAVAQFARYLPNAVKAWRVGVTPQQVRVTGRSIVQAGYEFNAEYNSAYWAWATARECKECGHTWHGEKVGSEYEWPAENCPECWGESRFSKGVWLGDQCWAIEVEALTPPEYVPYLIDVVIQACGGDEELRKKLLEMAEPNWPDVRYKLDRDVYAMSELFRRLAALSDWAESKRYEEVETPVDGWVRRVLGDEGDPQAWRHSEPVKEQIHKAIADQAGLITADSFREHAEGRGWNGWRPVDGAAANDAVTGQFTDDFSEAMGHIARAIDGGINGELENDAREAECDFIEDAEEFGIESPTGNELVTRVAERLADSFSWPSGLLEAVRGVFSTLADHDLAFDDD